jgi:small GTP-binding protein
MRTASHLGLADLADACFYLAPDAGCLDDIARVLGLEITLAREPQIKRQDPIRQDPAPVRDTPVGSRVLPPPRGENPSPVIAIAVEQLRAPAKRAALPREIRRATPLTNLTMVPYTPPAPLLPRRQVRAFLRDVASHVLPSPALDVEAVIEQLARLRLRTPLPRRKQRSFRRGVTVLVDEGPGMRPFRHDAANLRGAIQRIVGPHVRGEYFIAETPAGGIERYGGGSVPPRVGDRSTVLLITDLGLARPTDGKRATPAQWTDLANTFSRRGCRVVAVVPYARHRWPAAAKRSMRIVEWSAASSSRPRNVGTSIEELARLLSIAGHIDPALVRAARRHLMPFTDAGLEADFLFNKKLAISNPRTVTIQPAHLGRFRRELAEHSDELDRSRAFLTHYRQRTVTNDLLRAKEELVYHSLRRTRANQRNVEQQLAAAVRTLVDHTDDTDLARWAMSLLAELPEWVRHLQLGDYLETAARMKSVSAFVEDSLDRAPTTGSWLLPPETQVGVSVQGSSVVLRDPPVAGDQIITVPSTNPRLLSIRTGRQTYPPLRLRAAQTLTIDGALLPVELETLAGARYRIVETSPHGVTYATARVVLLGDSGSGKSGLGARLAADEFRETVSSHGQQIWRLPQLSSVSSDGTEQDVFLWDLAGQLDYRLVHAPLVAGVDLALLVFDESRSDDWFRGIDYWLTLLRDRSKQGEGGATRCPVILVSTRTDRGASRLTTKEIDTFCSSRGISAFVRTSARTRQGIDELLGRMRELIPWDQIPVTMTTAFFKRVRDAILVLKEHKSKRKHIFTLPELHKQLSLPKSDELPLVLNVLESHGYVLNLGVIDGLPRVLLDPELLNGMASSIVLEARRDPRGLGTIDEELILSGKIPHEELALSASEIRLLLTAAVRSFIEHNVCFREPVSHATFLVFPQLIVVDKQPSSDEEPLDEAISYTVKGAVENIFASLVVLLGYTSAITRVAQWRNEARYSIGTDLCGFRLDLQQDDEAELILAFAPRVRPSSRALFQSVFENFLIRGQVEATRYERVVCFNCHELQPLEAVAARIRSAQTYLFCANCGQRLTLPEHAVAVLRKPHDAAEGQERIAVQRSRFEQVLFRIATTVRKQPRCFITYGGTQDQDRWVERILAADLQKAAIDVQLDRWSTEAGISMSALIDYISRHEWIIVVGTPDYPKSRAAAAGVMKNVNSRLRSPSSNSVVPLLLEGDPHTSFTPLLQNRMVADFRDERLYFQHLFELLLQLHDLPSNTAEIQEMRASLSTKK